MTYHRDALNRLKTIHGIVLIVGFVIQIIGAILVLIEGIETPKAEDWLVALWWTVIALSNVLLFAYAQPIMAPVTGVIFLATVDILFTFTQLHDILPGQTLGMIGCILSIIGTLITFAAFPITFVRPKWGDKLTIAVIVASVLLIIGNILIWSKKVAVVHPLFLAIMYLVGNLWEFQILVDFAAFLAAFVLPSDWMSMVSSTGIFLGGYIIVCVALILIMAIYGYKMKLQGALNTNLPDNQSLKYRLKTVQGIILIVSFVITLIGAILVLIEGVETPPGEDWLIMLFWAFLICALNGVLFFFLQPNLLLLTGAFFLASVDTVFTLTHLHDVLPGQTVAMIGCILAIIGVLLSFVSFPLTFQKPNWTDKFTIAVIVVAILLIIGNILIWIDKSTVVHPAFLAFLYVVGNLWWFDRLVELVYFASSFFIALDWMIMVSSTKLGLAGWIIICVSLIAIIAMNTYRLVYRPAVRVVPVTHHHTVSVTQTHV